MESRGICAPRCSWASCASSMGAVEAAAAVTAAAEGCETGRAAVRGKVSGMAWLPMVSWPLASCSLAVKGRVADVVCAGPSRPIRSAAAWVMVGVRGELSSPKVLVGCCRGACAGCGTCPCACAACACACMKGLSAGLLRAAWVAMAAACSMLMPFRTLLGLLMSLSRCNWHLSISWRPTSCSMQNLSPYSGPNLARSFSIARTASWGVSNSMNAMPVGLPSTCMMKLMPSGLIL
mmetsp:Transcript_1677/g.4178  ORF Transcript_1677/g.4178 Transcript_1677/m.4178 type:complete len:235 (-) Transcript_1677:742-1446(-)